jgi:MOSC domain-containing protein YiiM
MFVKALNIGLPNKEKFFGKEIITGICKLPTSDPLFLSKLGLAGDGVGDLTHHGGYDKALCVYSIDHFPYWEKILGISLPPSPFGENLSISELHEDVICIGDIFQLGTAIVQVSQPRQPCSTLAARYGRSDMVKLVVNSGRTGFYFRVLEEGVIKTGNTLDLKEKDTRGITISFTNCVYYHEKRDIDAIEKVLAITALSESWRRSFQDLKEKVLNRM